MGGGGGGMIEHAIAGIADEAIKASTIAVRIPRIPFPRGFFTEHPPGSCPAQGGHAADFPVFSAGFPC
jgi:hypothetical protein